MRTVKVVAAVICDSLAEKRAVFAAARGYGEYRGLWEFPGGKIEPGESARQALVREIEEELAARVRVGPLLDTVEWDYPGFHLSMRCYWCEVLEGRLTPREAADTRWLRKAELYSVPWLPADRTLLEKIESQLR